MTFASVLYRGGRPEPAPEEGTEPAHFRDLYIDQIVAAVTAGRDEYDLRPFFHRPLRDTGEIAYRQEVMRDLECPRLLEVIMSFAAGMREVRLLLRASEQAHYHLNKNAWFFEAAVTYCSAVRGLMSGLAESEPCSLGLRELRQYLSEYVASECFTGVALDTETIAAELASVRYCVLIRGLSITVRDYNNESDYSAEIEQSFAKFRQGDVKDYRLKLSEYTAMGHVEAQIVELVAKLHPEIFDRFDRFCSEHRDFVHATLQRFDREVHFYISYLQYIRSIKGAGLRFCYPQLTEATKGVFGNEVFDLALAAKLTAEGAAVVPNDFYFEGDERVLVVSGPNQGGKTTFARTLGQLHYLAGLGLPVPGSKARLLLCDRILTHFEKQESIEDLRGKLADDLLRIRQILEEATTDSLLIINEIFSSTALEDAVLLASEIMRRILALGCLCVCVTFVDEIAALGPAVVSMVSTVAPQDPALRTFKLVRRQADGRAHAMAIAKKHRLDYRSLTERLAP